MRMTGRLRTQLGGRDIIYRDAAGLVHRCKGFEHRGGPRIFWTVCHMDAPAVRVRRRARGQAVTCPLCLAVLCEPARRILAAARSAPRPAVGGLPFKPELD
jgi:hypothetical protein